MAVDETACEKDFVCKSASFNFRQNKLEQKLVTLTIEVDQIDVSNDEAILCDGTAIGYVSSGGYGHRTKKSIAMGYVKSEFAKPGTNLQIEILGQFYDAKVLGSPLYDANGAKMRS